MAGSGIHPRRPARRSPDRSPARVALLSLLVAALVGRSGKSNGQLSGHVSDSEVHAPSLFEGCLPTFGRNHLQHAVMYLRLSHWAAVQRSEPWRVQSDVLRSAGGRTPTFRQEHCPMCSWGLLAGPADRPHGALGGVAALRFVGSSWTLRISDEDAAVQKARRGE